MESLAGPATCCSHSGWNDVKLLTAFVLFCLCNLALAQDPPRIADPGDRLQGVWHLGRVTGDLERIIAFYHDLLGLGFRGDRAAPIPFYSVAAINEFVGSPANAEFRAAFMPIPGGSAETDLARQVYLEAFEYRNIERHQYMPALSDPGVSMMNFVVRDLDTLVAEAKAAGVAFITPNGEPVSVAGARSVIMRDPDGYPVEITEITPLPASYAPGDSRILGARMSLVVDDLLAAMEFYWSFVGRIRPPSFRNPNWQRNPPGLGLPDADFRTFTIQLPGTAIPLDLIEYRDIEQKPYHPNFQDIGFGHIAFTTNDIEAVHATMTALGSKTLAASGRWTQINPNLRALYTRDNNGFFLEIIENRAPQSP